ncbi:hypothetical protein PBAL39_05981 [Pedobacter sp. BAL39]|nr:hypothetical protein PBAL39_05981 [Pedobacter sp. BAL39]
MAITNINYKDKGFWIPEAFIEVLSQYFCETCETIGVNIFSENLQKIYRQCYFNVRGENIGMVAISLNK